MTTGRWNVKVVTRASRRSVEAAGPGALTVRVTEPPADGRANEAVIEALAEHFGVPRRRVAILRGHTSRRKVIDILPEATQR